jgi:DNA-binding XRE family transcriptional regulator
VQSSVQENAAVAKGSAEDFSISIVNLDEPQSDIHMLIAEVEKTEAGREAMAEGRRWVAETFYSEASLSQLRLKKGLSQEQLARLAGMSQPQIARLEGGQTDPQASTVLRLAQALGFPKEDVFNAILNQLQPKG